MLPVWWHHSRSSSSSLSYQPSWDTIASRLLGKHLLPTLGAYTLLSGSLCTLKDVHTPASLLSFLMLPKGHLPSNLSVTVPCQNTSGGGCACVPLRSQLHQSPRTKQSHCCPQSPWGSLSWVEVSSRVWKHLVVLDASPAWRAGAGTLEEAVGGGTSERVWSLRTVC